MTTPELPVPPSTYVVAPSVAMQYSAHLSDTPDDVRLECEYVPPTTSSLGSGTTFAHPGYFALVVGPLRLNMPREQLDVLHAVIGDALAVQA